MNSTCLQAILQNYSGRENVKLVKLGESTQGSHGDSMNQRVIHP